MKYKVVFVCYLTRRKVQKQMAFISKATAEVSISDEFEAIDRELHQPLITVEFYETKAEAFKQARLYCSADNIFEEVE